MLRIENLSVHYGGIHALRGVSLEVGDGKIVSLLGANGAGKSSILRAICGLEKTDEGSHIYLGNDNLDLTKMEAKNIVKAGVAMIPERRRIFAGLTVAENLAMGAWIRKDPDGVQRDIEGIFEMFPILKERYHQKAVTLSGGESQRMKLAAELFRRATGNTLYILDEPTTGLHFEDIKILLGVLQQLVDQGNTVIIIEHNLDILKSVDYIFDMGPEGGFKGGRIISQGTPEQLAADPASVTGPYLKDVL